MVSYSPSGLDNAHARSKCSLAWSDSFRLMYPIASPRCRNVSDIG